MNFVALTASRVRERLSSYNGIVSQAASAAVAFIAGGAQLFPGFSPFGVAWAGSAAPEQALFTSLGAIAGYIIFGKGELTLRYLASIILLLGLRWAFSFVSKTRIQFYTPLLAALSVATTGMAVAFSGDHTPYSIIMVICETATTATDRKSVV